MENLNLARALAWSFHYSTGLEVDELTGEACLAYVEALQNYDPRKSGILTYTYAVMANHLRDYVAKQKKLRDLMARYAEEGPESVDYRSPDSIYAFKDLLSNLSKEARTVCGIVLSSPQDFSIPPKLARSRMIQTLRERGWTWALIWSVFREVKSALSETA